jgi:peptidoglycan/LPS O-acetylase OafA/YrhL
MKRQHPLDSLRGVLSLVVVAAHTWQIFIHPAGAIGTPWSAMVFGLSARVAVMAFFALSGFVITGSIASNIERSGAFEAERYLLARVFRIVPPLLTVIAGTVVLYFILDLFGALQVTLPGAARRAFTIDPTGQLWAIASLCTQGELTGAWLNGPLWSLTFEIRIYVVAGLLAVAFFGRGWLARLTACVLLWVFVTSIKLDAVFTSGIDLQAASFAAFLCGAIAYAFRNSSILRLSGAAILFGLVAVLRASQARASLPDAIDSSPVLLAAQVAVAGACASLIACVAQGREWPVFRRAGEYSYTLYIGHFPLLLAAYFLLAKFRPELLTWPASAPTAVIAGFTAWVLLSKLGRRIEQPQLQRQAVSQLLGAIESTWRRAAITAAATIGFCIPLVSSSTQQIAVLQLFGDSTQVMAHPLIQARFGKNVINSARVETRSDMLLNGTDGANLPWPRSVRADFVLINHGMNDARPWAHVSIEEYKRNLRRFAEAPAQVIFETPNPSTAPGRDTTDYAQAMREVGSELNIRVIDVHTCFMRQSDWRARLYDGVHPDPKGLLYIVDQCVMPSLMREISD